MDLLKSLLEAQGGGLVQQVAQQVGLDGRQASSAIGALLPSLAAGMQSNIAKPGGLEGLLGAVQSGNHERYIDNPAELANAQADGNGILGHLLGSKDVSRQVAAQASQATGIDTEKLKSMLPMIAAMMMGSVSKKVGGGEGASAQPAMPAGAAAALEGLTGGNNPLTSILGQFLGADGGPAQPQATAQPQTKGGIFDMARKLFK